MNIKARDSKARERSTDSVVERGGGVDNLREEYAVMLRDDPRSTDLFPSFAQALACATRYGDRGNATTVYKLFAECGPPEEE